MNEISNIDMEKPFFTPWIGENYFNGIDGTGIKVMVVGASHYCGTSKKIPDCQDCLNNSEEAQKNCPDPQNRDLHNPNNSSATQNVIKEYFDIKGSIISDNYLRTFNNFQSAFLNEYVRKPEEREKFWNSVIFYNYYQDFRGGASSGKFNKKRANAFFEPFANTVNALKPDIIFCWGSQVASVMREHAKLEELQRFIYKSSIKGEEPIVVLVHHPCQGFSYNYWHEQIKKALEIAISNKPI